VEKGGELPPPLRALHDSLAAGGAPPASDNLEALLRGAGVAWARRAGPASRRSLVARWPRTLALHLRRSAWSPAGQRLKVVGRVAFAARMEVQEAGGGGGAGGAGRGRRSYALRAAVVHTGLSSETGHYVAYRRLDGDAAAGTAAGGGGAAAGGAAEATRRWVRVSDEVVEGVGEGEVLAAQATLLVYEATAAPATARARDGAAGSPRGE
jgi:ubiquitin carboxyl-terminal hydrolase 1